MTSVILRGKISPLSGDFAEGQEAQVAPLVAELVHMRVDIIVTDGNQTTNVAKSETKTIPIVMASESDPVGMGTVASLARPDGNITGLSNLIEGLSAKRLEILTETLPGISRVAAIWNPENPQAVSSFEEEQIATRR
jgi:putative ABC transport system substrate-binding protein